MFAVTDCYVSLMFWGLGVGVWTKNALWVSPKEYKTLQSYGVCEEWLDMAQPIEFCSEALQDEYMDLLEGEVM